MSSCVVECTNLRSSLPLSHIILSVAYGQLIAVAKWLNLLNPLETTISSHILLLSLLGLVADEWILTTPLIVQAECLITAPEGCSSSTEVTVHTVVSVSKTATLLDRVVLVVVYLRLVGHPDVPRPDNSTLLVKCSQQGVTLVVRGCECNSALSVVDI